MNFIDEMSNYLVKKYPLKSLWANLLSATTLASVLTPDTYFENKYGKNRCNMWIAYLAPSGDFKSVPMDEVTLELMRHVGKALGREIILPSIASTVEGMIKHFKQYEKERSGLIMRDELTTFFKESLHKRYLTDEMEIYSKMYDGKIMPRRTMCFHSKHPMEVYVNLIGATTPKYLYEQLPINFFYQGCGNRLLYVRHNIQVKTNYSVDDLFMFERKWIDEERQLPSELANFAEFLKVVGAGRFEILMSDPKAMDLSLKFRNEREKLKDQIKDSDPEAFKKEYISRDWQKSLKLAQLRCISRTPIQNIQLMDKGKTGRVIDISVEDVEWGQQIIRACYENFETIVQEWKMHIAMEPTRLKSETVYAYQYLQVIKDYGIVSQARLAHDVGNPRRDDRFYDILGYLVNTGCVSTIKDSEFIRMKGIEWMKKMMIDPSFKRPPQLYKFEKLLEK